MGNDDVVDWHQWAGSASAPPSQEYDWDDDDASYWKRYFDDDEYSSDLDYYGQKDQYNDNDDYYHWRWRNIDDDDVSNVPGSSPSAFGRDRNSSSMSPENRTSLSVLLVIFLGILIFLIIPVGLGYYYYYYTQKRQQERASTSSSSTSSPTTATLRQERVRAQMALSHQLFVQRHSSSVAAMQQIQQQRHSSTSSSRPQHPPTGMTLSRQQSSRHLLLQVAAQSSPSLPAVTTERQRERRYRELLELFRENNVTKRLTLEDFRRPQAPSLLPSPRTRTDDGTNKKGDDEMTLKEEDSIVDCDSQSTTNVESDSEEPTVEDDDDGGDSVGKDFSSTGGHVRRDMELGITTDNGDTKIGTSIDDDDDGDRQCDDCHSDEDEAAATTVIAIAIPTTTSRTRHLEEGEVVTKTFPNCCTICLASYQEGETIAWSSNPDCCHAYHQSCILDWLLLAAPTLPQQPSSTTTTTDSSLPPLLPYIFTWSEDFQQWQARQETAGGSSEALASSSPTCPCCRQVFVP